jgi:hypothetical protein
MQLIVLCPLWLAMNWNGTSRVPYKKQLIAVGNGLAQFRVQLVGWVIVLEEYGVTECL